MMSVHKNELLHFRGNSVAVCKFSEYDVFIIDINLLEKSSVCTLECPASLPSEISSGPNYRLLLV